MRGEARAFARVLVCIYTNDAIQIEANYCVLHNKLGSSSCIQYSSRLDRQAKNLSLLYKAKCNSVLVDGSSSDSVVIIPIRYTSNKVTV